ncbi:helix-turn-helix domain-containing protein [Streptomyces sp. NPDC054844]
MAACPPGRGYDREDTPTRAPATARLVILGVNHRFAALGLTGLADRKRSGRPPRFTALQVAQVKALACRLPSEADAPLSH